MVPVKRTGMFLPVHFYRYVFTGTVKEEEDGGGEGPKILTRWPSSVSWAGTWTKCPPSHANEPVRSAAERSGAKA